VAEATSSGTSSGITASDGARGRERWLLPQFARETWLVLLLTFAAGLLRIFRLGSNSLWVDEFATLQTVTLPLSQIARSAAEVAFCPPLYFWLVHGLVSLAGVSEVSLRLVSAIAGTLTIPVAWVLVRELTGNRYTAAVCASLLAVSPLHIWYSQEARAYALLVCLGSTALLFLLRAMRTGAVASWAGFIASMASLLLTHTTGAAMLGVAWIWVLISPRRASHIRPLLIATAVLALITAPVALTVTEAVANASGMHSPPRPVTGLEIPYTLFIYVVGYSFGPSTRDIQNLGPAAAVRLHAIESAVGATAVCLLILMILRRTPGAAYFVSAFALPLVAMLVGSMMSGKAFQPRYALVGLVGFYGLTASALGGVSRRLRTPATAAALLLCAWSDVQWYFTPTYWKDDSRAVIDWLADRVPAGSAVVPTPGCVTGVLSYYAELQHATIHFVPLDSLMAPLDPAALLLTRLHHVADPRSVRAQFRRAAGSPVREYSVGGYQVLLKDGGEARPSSE
jgi:mannosyltransferase